MNNSNLIDDIDQGGDGHHIAPTSVNNIAAVSVRVPPFWKANPALWFCQLESQFETSRIVVDKTKYHTAVAAIDSSILSQVSDVVLNPPSENLYLNLKTKILERFADSDECRLKKLLTGLILGDKRPSQLLREMRELAGNGLSANALKSLWLQRLPSQCQAILTVSEDDLDRLALMADKISNVYGSEIYSISECSEISTEKNLLSKIEVLTKQVSQLSNEVNSLMNPSFRSRSKSRSQSQSRFRSKSRTKNDLCWYHAKFAEKASKCVKPCSFKSTEN